MSVSQKLNVAVVVQPGSPKPDEIAASTSPLKTESVSNCTPALSSKPTRLRDQFVIALKVEKMAPRTINAYCNAVQMLTDFLHRSPLLGISVNDIRAFFFTLSASVSMRHDHSIRFTMD